MSMINFKRPCPVCGNFKHDDKVYRCPSCGSLICENCLPGTTCPICNGRVTWENHIGWFDNE